MTESRQYGKFQLSERIGSSPLGETWRASVIGAPGGERTVAVTLLSTELTDDSDFVKTLVTEARTLVSLAQTNVIAVFEAGRANGVYYVVKEYTPGSPFAEIVSETVRSGESLPVEHGLYLAMEILAGLAYAYGRTDSAGLPQKLVHGNLTGDSVAIGTDGSVKIDNFVLARAAVVIDRKRGQGHPGLLVAAPEVQMGGTPDARTDVYAVGVLLWEILAGRSYDGRVSLGSVRRDLPAGLDAVVVRALDSVPEARIATAEAMRDELERIAFAAGRRTTAAIFAEYLRKRRAREARGAAQVSAAHVAFADTAFATAPERVGESAMSASTPRTEEPSVAYAGLVAAPADRPKNDAGKKNGSAATAATPHADNPTAPFDPTGAPSNFSAATKSAMDDALSLFVSPSGAAAESQASGGAPRERRVTPSDEALRPATMAPVRIQPAYDDGVPQRRGGAVAWALGVACVLLVGLIALLLEHFQPGFYKNLFSGQLDQAKIAKKQAAIDRAREERERTAPKYGHAKISANVPATYVISGTDNLGAPLEQKFDYLQGLDLRDRDIARPFTVRIEAKGYVPQTVTVGRDDWTTKGDLNTLLKSVVLECSPDNKECIDAEAAARAEVEKEQASAGSPAVKKRRAGGGGRRTKVWDEETRSWR